MELADRIAEINKSLSQCAIRRRGNRLSIRGTFPPKPGDGNRAKSYEIATGKPATFAGLVQVKAIAQEIDGLLIRDRFDWTPWLKGVQKPAQTVGEWLASFEAAHWAKTPQSPTKLNSWHKDYELKFNHLPPGELLSIELLQTVIERRSKAGTRSRVGYVFAFRQLAEFANLESASDLAALGKGYKSGSINPRSLPTDAAILKASERFTGGWHWLYVSLAVYGLRPHEVFRVETDRLSEDPPLLMVPTETKTGDRLAFPIPADDWSFDVTACELPPVRIEGRNNNQLGLAVSQKFRQLKLEFNPYDLRHSFARRGFEMGFPPDFLARSMGHSLEVHLKTYRAWWGDAPYLKVYREVMSRRR